METNSTPGGHVNCKNCDNQFQGNFCNNCGQTANTHAINWHYIVHDIQHGIFHVDKGILFTIKELFLRPGQTIRHFIAGKRMDYFKPIALTFILASICGFFSLYFELDHTFTIGPNESEQIKMQKEFEHFMVTHYALVILAIIPFYTLASYIMFRKSKYNFMEHVVVNLYVASLKLIVQIALIPMLYFSQGSGFYGAAIGISLMVDILFAVYIFSSVFNMYSRGARIFRSLISYLLGTFFITLLTIIVVIVFATVFKS